MSAIIKKALKYGMIGLTGHEIGEQFEKPIQHFEKPETNIINNTKNNENNNIWWLIILVIFVLIIIFVIVISLCILLIKKNKSNRKNQSDIELK